MTDWQKDQLGLKAMSSLLGSWGKPMSADLLQERFYQPWDRLMAERKQMLHEPDVLGLLASVVDNSCGSQEQLRQLMLAFCGPSIAHVVCDPGAAQLLADLTADGLKLGLISNTPVPGYCHDLALNRLGLLHLLPFRLYSFDAQIRKPAADIFKMAMAKAGTLPEESLMIGDSVELDIIPARQLGMLTIHYSGRASVADACDPSVPSLSQCLELVARWR